MKSTSLTHSGSKVKLDGNLSLFTELGIVILYCQFSYLIDFCLTHCIIVCIVFLFGICCCYCWNEVTHTTSHGVKNEQKYKPFFNAQRCPKDVQAIQHGYSSKVLSPYILWSDQIWELKHCRYSFYQIMPCPACSSYLQWCCLGYYSPSKKNARLCNIWIDYSFLLLTLNNSPTSFLYENLSCHPFHLSPALIYDALWVAISQPAGWAWYSSFAE